jgi:hypothetical protein
MRDSKCYSSNRDANCFGAFWLSDTYRTSPPFRSASGLTPMNLAGRVGRGRPPNTREDSPGTSGAPWAWQLRSVPLDILTSFTHMRWIHRNSASPPFNLGRELGVTAREAVARGVGLLPCDSCRPPLWFTYASVFYRTSPPFRLPSGVSPDRHGSQPRHESARMDCTWLEWFDTLNALAPAPPRSCGRNSQTAGRPRPADH